MVVVERAAPNVKGRDFRAPAVFCQYEKKQPLTWSLVSLAPGLTGNKGRSCTGEKGHSLRENPSSPEGGLLLESTYGGNLVARLYVAA